MKTYSHLSRGKPLGAVGRHRYAESVGKVDELASYGSPCPPLPCWKKREKHIG